MDNFNLQDYIASGKLHANSKTLTEAKKQGYDDREDESLGARKGAEKDKKQSMKARRDDSYGKFGKRDAEKKGKNKINKEGVVKENVMVNPIIMFGGKKYIKDVISSPDDFGFEEDDAEWVKNNILSSPKMVSIQNYMDLDDKWVKQAQIDTSGGGALDHVVDGLKVHVKQGLITPEQEKEAMKVVGLAEGPIDENARTDAEQEGYKDGFDDAKDDVKDALSKMKVSELKAKIKETILAELTLSEADEEVDVDIDVEDEVEIDAEADDIEIERKGVTTAKVEVGLSPEEEIVQDSLKAAMDAAQALGSDKLADQIGNTITFFTRQFVVGDRTD